MFVNFRSLFAVALSSALVFVLIDFLGPLKAHAANHSDLDACIETSLERAVTTERLSQMSREQRNQIINTLELKEQCTLKPLKTESDGVISYWSHPAHPLFRMEAKFSSACAEHVAVSAEIFVAGQAFSWSEQTPVLQSLISLIQERCPQVSDIYLKTTPYLSSQNAPPPLGPASQYALLSKATNWQEEPAQPIDHLYYNDAVVTFASQGLSGAFLVAPDLSFHGVIYLPNQLNIPMRFRGQFKQVQVADKSRPYPVEYVAEGEWQGFGDQTHHCNTPMKGYAHWGRYRLSASNNPKFYLDTCPGDGSAAREDSYGPVYWNENSQWNTRARFTKVAADEKAFLQLFNPAPGTWVTADPEQEALRQQKESAEIDKAKSRLER